MQTYMDGSGPDALNMNSSNSYVKMKQRKTPAEPLSPGKRHLCKAHSSETYQPINYPDTTIRIAASPTHLRNSVVGLQSYMTFSLV